VECQCRKLISFYRSSNQRSSKAYMKETIQHKNLILDVHLKQHKQKLHKIQMQEFSGLKSGEHLTFWEKMIEGNWEGS